MEGNNTAPFEIGETVVAVMGGHDIVKGNEYVVLGTNRSCCVWHVDVGVKIPFNAVCRCKHCGFDSPVSRGDVWWLAHKMFARIQRDHELEVEKEVLDSLPKITEERADPLVLKPKPATVTNLHQQLLDSIDEMIELLPSLPEDEQEEYATGIKNMIEKAKQLIQCS